MLIQRKENRNSPISGGCRAGLVHRSLRLFHQIRVNAVIAVEVFDLFRRKFLLDDRRSALAMVGGLGFA
ncbi:hypothetical protein D3C80_2144410 [compost metagenome]